METMAKYPVGRPLNPPPPPPPTPTNHDFLLTTDLMLIIVIQVLGLKVHKYLIICINHFAVVVVG